MVARLAIVIFALMLLVLNWRLWVDSDGVAQTQRLKTELVAGDAEIARLEARNAALDAEVQDLKNGGLSVIESRARMTMGMIRPDERFYLVVRQ